MLLKPLPGEKHEAVWQCFCLLINACWLVYKMRGQTGWQNKSKFVHKKKKKRIKHYYTLGSHDPRGDNVIGTMNKEVNVSGLECFTITKWRIMKM